MKCVGIDLAGKEKNPTGFAVLNNQKINSQILNKDKEIIEKCELKNPDIIAIDSPLSFPKNDEGFRDSDLKLIERGYRVLPPELGGMEALTKRGTKLAQKLDELNHKNIEIHPLTSGRVLFGTKSRDEWVRNLSEEDWEVKQDLDKHQVDSILAAFTGYLHLKNKTEKIGGDDGIIIPKDCLSAL